MKKTISDNIRIIRESNGYSQDYVAARLKISQQAYSQIEKTPENATLKRLKEIANILNVHLITLIDEDKTFIQQNYHQSGGNAAAQMQITGNIDFEKEVYNKIITELKDEIVFLRSLVGKP